MAETESKPRGTVLEAVIGGKPAKVGDEVMWRGAVRVLADDGPRVTHNRPTVMLVGNASPVVTRELSRYERPEEPKAKAKATAVPASGSVAK